MTIVLFLNSNEINPFLQEDRFFACGGINVIYHFIILLFNFIKICNFCQQCLQNKKAGELVLRGI